MIFWHNHVQCIQRFVYWVWILGILVTVRLPGSFPSHNDHRHTGIPVWSPASVIFIIKLIYDHAIHISLVILGLDYIEVVQLKRVIKCAPIGLFIGAREHKLLTETNQFKETIGNDRNYSTKRMKCTERAGHARKGPPVPMYVPKCTRGRTRALQRCMQGRATRPVPVESSARNPSEFRKIDLRASPWSWKPWSILVLS